jgi:hypothetical protein
MTTDENFNFTVGTTIDKRYVIKEELGRGGFGVVYLVSDQHFSPHPVERALKFLKVTQDAADWRWERFLDESLRLAPMTHPGLVKVMDRGIHNGFLYFVMEYLGRRTLRSVLQAFPNGLALNLAIGIITEIGNILAALHNQNIYHCDVKPANIMLCSHEGGSEQVKIIDLGTARLKDPLRMKQHDFPFPVGTPNYMAPEQFSVTADSERISAATDIYAFAIIVYEMLTGVHPFRESQGASLNRNAQLTPASKLREGLTSRVDAILLRALADEPADRYQDASEFVESLKTELGMNSAEVEPEIGKARSGDRVLILAADSTADEQIAAELVAAFSEHGLNAIHMGNAIGIEAAEALEEEFQTTRLVVALVSKESLIDAVWITATKEASKLAQAKRLRLVFVMIEDDVSIPQACDTAQIAKWRPLAASSVATEIIDGITTPPTLLISGPPSHESPFGALFDGHRLYIERAVDTRFLEAVKTKQSTLLVNGPRRFGKSSLLLRGIEVATQSGFRVVKTDCKGLDQEQFSSLKQFYLALGRNIAHDLRLSRMLNDTWDDLVGPNINFREYLLDHVLSDERHLFWVLDGADRIFTRPFRNDVFALFRSWHNDRSKHATGKAWKRLTLAIGYATEVRRLIDNENQSPFNVGIECVLSSFTFEEVKELNRRYGALLNEEHEIAQFFRYTGGHPLLTQHGLGFLRNNSWNELRQIAVHLIGPFGQHLRSLGHAVQSNSQIRAGLTKLLQNAGGLTEDEFYQLWASGLAAGSEPAEAIISCELYEDFFRRELGLSSTSSIDPRYKRIFSRFRRKS